MNRKEYLELISSYNIVGNMGLNETEILDIENKLNLKLPNFYKEFLKLFGKDSGNILSGYYSTYPILFENKEDAIYELNFDDRREKKLTFKDSYFFFAQWQGYNFYFFDCNSEIDNPKIFVFDSEEIKEVYNNFKEFLIENINT